MRKRVLWYTYDTQSWSVTCAPVLSQAVEPETKDSATSRAAFLSLLISLPPTGFCKCCVHALILSLASLK